MASRALTTWSEKLVAKLSDKAYRVAYVQQHVKTWIAYQIRALRDQRGWNQGKLAAEMQKPQSVVSRIEDPDYGKLTLQTLFEVASAFDVAVVITFVDYKTFLAKSRNVSRSEMRVASFSAASLRAPKAQKWQLEIRDLFDHVETVAQPPPPSTGSKAQTYSLGAQDRSAIDFAVTPSLPEASAVMPAYMIPVPRATGHVGVL